MCIPLSPDVWSSVHLVMQEMLVVLEIFIKCFGHKVVFCEKVSKCTGRRHFVDSSVAQLLPFLHDRQIICIGKIVPEDEASIVELSKSVPFT